MNSLYLKTSKKVFCDLHEVVSNYTIEYMLALNKERAPYLHDRHYTLLCSQSFRKQKMIHTRLPTWQALGIYKRRPSGGNWQGKWTNIGDSKHCKKSYI